jgi:hypothetical protein
LHGEGIERAVTLGSTTADKNLNVVLGARFGQTIGALGGGFAREGRACDLVVRDGGRARVVFRRSCRHSSVGRGDAGWPDGACPSMKVILKDPPGPARSVLVCHDARRSFLKVAPMVFRAAAVDVHGSLPLPLSLSHSP